MDSIMLPNRVLFESQLVGHKDSKDDKKIERTSSDFKSYT